MHRLICTLSFIFFSGCMGVNEPDRMIYPTRKHFLVEDPFSKGNGIEVGFNKFGSGELTLTYIEPDRINEFSDTLENRIDLWVVRTPNLMSSRDIAEKVDLHIHLFAKDSETASIEERDSEIRISSKGTVDTWRIEFQAPLSWKSYPGSKKGIMFGIPDSLFKSSPVISWFFVRTIDGKEVMIPPHPSLCILDEDRFRKQIY